MIWRGVCCLLSWLIWLLLKTWVEKIDKMIWGKKGDLGLRRKIKETSCARKRIGKLLQIASVLFEVGLGLAMQWQWNLFLQFFFLESTQEVVRILFWSPLFFLEIFFGTFLKESLHVSCKSEGYISE